MAVTRDRSSAGPLHPLHAALLAGMATLFLATFLADLAYACSAEIQWKNFASWLIVGGLVFGGLALLWALVALLRSAHGREPILYLLLLLATWILGFINALVHAKDAWASMPAALILATIVALLAVAAAGLGFSTLRSGDAK